MRQTSLGESVPCSLVRFFLSALHPGSESLLFSKKRTKERAVLVSGFHPTGSQVVVQASFQVRSDLDLVLCASLLAEVELHVARAAAIITAAKLGDSCSPDCGIPENGDGSPVAKASKARGLDRGHELLDFIRLNHRCRAAANAAAWGSLPMRRG